MTEMIITKQCFRCKLIKPLSEFTKNRSRKFGVSAYCRICDNKEKKKYRQSINGSHKRHQYQIKYRRTMQGRASQLKYQRSKRGKDCNHRHCKRFAKMRPECIKAKYAVKEAIRKGVLISAKKQLCKICKRLASDYHHYLGYAKENRLDVIPVCRKCHVYIHSNGLFSQISQQCTAK